jgi:Ca2+/Na+ antiporter
MPRTAVPSQRNRFLRRHSLSIAALVIVGVWVVLYVRADSKTHLGAFFGNAIADWTGVVGTVIATKYLYEIGSKAKRPPGEGFRSRVHEVLRDHHLTIFLLLTGIAWLLLYLKMDSEAKWGQVVGSIVSEWTQILGLVLITKRFMETKPRQSR